MSELLCEQRSLVNDLSDYGSELSSLTGCDQVSVEAEELSHWHECLRQNARHKTTEITAALQQAASHVSRCHNHRYHLFFKNMKNVTAYPRSFKVYECCTALVGLYPARY